MRGSEVSVPEGPHAVKSTASLSIRCGVSVAGMLQHDTNAHAIRLIHCSGSGKDGNLHRSIHIAFE